MTTFLDWLTGTGGISQQIGLYDFFLPFLLVFTLVFALLEKLKLASDRSDVNAVIALVLGLIVALTPKAGLYIVSLVPYFVVFLIILFGVMLLFLLTGVSAGDIGKAMHNAGAWVFFIAMSLIIVMVVTSNIFGAGLYPNLTVQTSQGPKNLTQAQYCASSPMTGENAFPCIFGNPRFMGAIAVLFAMIFATIMITRKAG